LKTDLKSEKIEQVIESVKNQSWKDVLYAWKSVIEKDENKDWTNFLANTVWLNKQVKIDKRTISFKWEYINLFPLI
jgi:vacuolar-type H+-ATPase subunit C/Vma6